jgi:ribonuclease BN (tRNA processing enzyme)
VHISLLPCGVDQPGFPLTGLLVDDVLAVDAGPLGLSGSAAELQRIQTILLTHAHIDHIAGLPLLLDTVYGLGPPPCVWASAETLHILQTDLFNNRLMPDFLALSKVMTPFLRTQVLEAGETVQLGSYHVTTYKLDHTVPTLGYVIDDGQAAIAFFTDSAPVPDVLEQMLQNPRVRVLFLELSFPDRLAELARVSKHFCLGDFLAAARQVPDSVRVVPIHMKPRYAAELIDSLRQARLPNLEIHLPGSRVDLG